MLNQLSSSNTDHSLVVRHAGYTYSGPCAGWAYKVLDLSQAKRVFILGPNHSYGLSWCAATTFAKYETVFGDLVVDTATVDKIVAEGDFEKIPAGADKREHSLEMHTPFLWKRLVQTFGSPADFPPIVPLIIGSITRQQEKRVGQVLKPYLQDPENAFIVSSDFCHWGPHFAYQRYAPTGQPDNLVDLQDRGVPYPSSGPKIHQTIEMIDKHAMDAIETASHDSFADSLKLTKNTVCGRHPIGVVMAGLEVLRAEQGEQSGSHELGRFHMLRYERSNLVEQRDDTSVSYVSAYAVL